MRVLLIIIQFPPDVNAAGLLMEQVCRGLLALGHQVSVITAFPHYEKFRVWDEYRGKLAERRDLHGMDVLRLFIHANGAKHSMLHRFLSYFSFNALATFAGLLSSERYDVVLCPNGSFLSGLTAAIISWVKGIPFVWNVQDLYPEVPARTGQIKNRFALGLMDRLARFFDARAAHVGDHGAEPVVEHAGLQLEPHPEPHRPLVHAREQRQHVVAAHEPALEIVHLALGPKDRVVNLDGLGQQLFVGNDDLGLGH